MVFRGLISNLVDSTDQGFSGLEKLYKFNDEQFLEIARHPLNLPRNEEDFLRRIKSIYISLKKNLFGTAHDIEKDNRKTLSKDTSYENLISQSILLQKNQRKKEAAKNEKNDYWAFFKLALEKGLEFTEYDQAFLGVWVDFSKLDVLKKRKIAVQAAAQIKWFLKGGKINSTEQMRNQILNDSRLGELLEIFTFIHSDTECRRDRTMLDWISGIDPRPKERRKGRPSKKTSKEDPNFKEIKPIPGIFIGNPEKVNFIYLSYAITVLSRILRCMHFPENEIVKFLVIEKYKEILPFYLRRLIDEWIQEAFSENGSIYH